MVDPEPIVDESSIVESDDDPEPKVEESSSISKSSLEGDVAPEPVLVDGESIVEPEPVAVGVAVGVEEPEPIVELESVAVGVEEPEPIVELESVAEPDPIVLELEPVADEPEFAKAGTAMTAVTNVHNKSFFIRPPWSF